jgi:opacity protein-like surface antigen
LTTSNFTTAYVDIDDHSQETYDFKYYTPWRFGLSLGHTVGSSLALGAGYEFTDFSSCDMRYITGTGSNGDESRSDADMNDEIGYSLKGVHTLKVGAEFRPDPAVAVRLGYNFVSPKYGDNDVAYRNQKTYSPGVYYASTTDYTNWRATHRITAGIGTKIDKFSVDLAYQYSMTKGDFFPFADGEYYEGNGMYIENVTPVTKVDFKRHQVLLTLGYSF